MISRQRPRTSSSTQATRRQVPRACSMGRAGYSSVQESNNATSGEPGNSPKHGLGSQFIVSNVGWQCVFEAGRRPHPENFSPTPEETGRAFLQIGPNQRLKSTPASSVAGARVAGNAAGKRRSDNKPPVSRATAVGARDRLSGSQNFSGTIRRVGLAVLQPGAAWSTGANALHAGDES